MAGKSSRFPDMRPKWMLTHPATNRFMVHESISGLNLNFFDKIYFVCLKEHEEKYKFLKGFEDELKDMELAYPKSEVILLDEQTSSQPETVALAIKKRNINGFILIKDSDNYFEYKFDSTNNQVCFFDLNNIDHINARTKSYIHLDTNNIINNIVEKKVISSTFCVGGYGFESALHFLKYYEEVKKLEGEAYISHIIYEMMLDSKAFRGVETKSFVDWGTLEDWNKYKSDFKVLFMDLDGTLVENSSIHFPPLIGTGTPLSKNIEYLKKQYSSGKIKVIITTSRPESYKDITVKELNKHGIPYDQLIMGLPHCQRVLVNDFSKSNPYPSCDGINVPRNSDNLQEYFESK